MRLKFFKRSADKFQSRIDPHSEAYRDLRVIFPRTVVSQPGLINDFYFLQFPGRVKF
jgi:hypothetical protein